MPDPPYVLPAHVIRVPSGSGFPLHAIGRALAHALGDRGSALAARLPVLRAHVVDALIERYARQNALIGTAGGATRVAMPLLTMNQVRLLLRIADAYGFEIDKTRIPEVAGVVAGGLGFRAVARMALGYVPFMGFLVRGGVAYGGTRAIGEAARRYFEQRAPVTRVDRDRELFPSSARQPAPRRARRRRDAPNGRRSGCARSRRRARGRRPSRRSRRDRRRR